MNRFVVAVVWTSVVPGSAAAQMADATAEASGPWMERLEAVDDLYEDKRTAEALTELEVMLSERPGDYEALWRAARASFGLGVLEVDIESLRDQFYARSVGYAARAAEVEPEKTRGHYWLAAAYGRQALHAGTSERTQLARRILESARRVIELDPEDAGAHHVLGKLHFEVRSVSGWQRWLGERFFDGGSVLGEASYEAAREHLEKAVLNDPNVIVYRLDLAVLYERIEQDELAREQLKTILAMPARDPFDQGLQRDARRMLEQL